MNVAVVVAARDEGRWLYLTLEALAHRTQAPHGVVVVDDGSIDGCADFLRPRAWPGVTLLTTAGEGPAAARNRGAAVAQDADVVVFLDAHCFPAAGWLAALVAALDAPGVGLATPTLVDARDRRRVGCGLTVTGPDLRLSWLRPRPGPPRAVPVAGTGCLAMRREAFDAMGGFAPLPDLGHEDLELCLRAWTFGWSTVGVSAVEVAHRFRAGADADWRPALVRNSLWLAEVHFGLERRSRVRGALLQSAGAAAVVEAWDSAPARRFRAALPRRVRDGDAWAKAWTLPL